MIIPLHNERENVLPLVERLRATLKKGEYEIVLVDDGSTDGTLEKVREAARTHEHVKTIILQKNYGQTAALSAGVDHASGDILIPMDGDLENDPADIPRLIEKITEGYDLVSGWRVARWNNQLLSRRIPSAFANRLISAISGLSLHDYGCTLKAYRREVLKGIRLYGDMHRFIAAYAHWNGARITEIPVRYEPRTYGKTHYGLSRTWKVLLDLITLKFLSGYATKPIHVFGATGLISIFFGIVAGAAALFFKLSTAYHKDFIQTPLPVLMAMLTVVGILLIMMGLLAEILVRTYHESQGKTTYTVKEKINL